MLSRNQALNKFAQYILSFRILDANSRVISYGCASLPASLAVEFLLTSPPCKQSETVRSFT